MCQTFLRNNSSGRNSGFTLTEVMVSMLIFLVASMGLLPLLLTNLQVNRDNNLHGQARRLASEVMVEMQVIDYADLERIPDDPLRVAAIELRQETEVDVPQSGQTRLTVTTRWQQQGKTHRYQLQSIRTAP